MANFVLEDRDYIGEEEGIKFYASIKDKLEFVNTIEFPVNRDISKSFIRGFQEYRDENFYFIFFCADPEQEKKIREDQKFLEDSRGMKHWDTVFAGRRNFINKKENKNGNKNNRTV